MSTGLLTKSNAERAAFAAMILIGLLPVLVPGRFITMDGGAHAYNAHIIHDLLFSDVSVYAQYFAFNPKPVPNWTGHLLLTLFNLALPAALAEKLLFLLYLIATPLVFRALMVKQGGSPLSAWLIFPLQHHMMLYLGFINFCLGITLAFAFILLYLKYAPKFTVWRAVVLCILSVVLYFTHLFPYIVALLFVGCHQLLILIRKIAADGFRMALAAWAKDLFLLFLGLVPSLALVALYAFGDFERGEPHYNSFARTVGRIRNFDVIMMPQWSYHLWVRAISAGMLAFVLLSIPRSKAALRSLVARPDSNSWMAWAMLACGLGIALFILPDDDGMASYILPRVFLFAVLALLLACGTMHPRSRVRGLVSVVTALLSVPLLIGWSIKEIGLSKQYTGMMEARQMVPDSTEIVTANFNRENWLVLHMTNYFAERGNIMAWDNYEAQKGYFPIVWREEKIPNVMVGSMDVLEACTKWKAEPAHGKAYPVPYVLTLDGPDGAPCMAEFKAGLDRDYTRIFSNDVVSLYRLSRSRSD